MRLPHGSECDRARALALARPRCRGGRVRPGRAAPASAGVRRVRAGRGRDGARDRSRPRDAEARALPDARGRRLPVAPARRRAGRSALAAARRRRRRGRGRAPGRWWPRTPSRSRAAPSHTIVVAELAPLDHQFRSIREGRLLLRLPPPPCAPRTCAASLCSPRAAGTVRACRSFPPPPHASDTSTRPPVWRPPSRRTTSGRNCAPDARSTAASGGVSLGVTMSAVAALWRW